MLLTRKKHWSIKSQQAMLSRLEQVLAHKRLFEKCGSLGVEFLSPAFDSESLFFLVDVIGVRRLKIPSGELTNLPFVLEHAKTGLDIIVSTGMANLSEIEAALAVIAFGYTCDSHEVVPSQAAFENAYASAEGQKALKEKVTIFLYDRVPGASRGNQFAGDFNLQKPSILKPVTPTTVRVIP